jgi:hypothetical protein
MGVDIFSPGRRINVKMPITLLTYSDGAKAFHEAFTINLSIGGARVRASVPLMAGQTIEIIPRQNPRLSIPSRVVWVGKSGTTSEGEAGIEFVRYSTKSLLSALF